MSDKKQKREQFKTPAGVAVFPRLTKADTKFNADGIYSLRLRLSKDEAQPIIDKVDELGAQALAEAKAALIKDGKKAAAAKLKLMEDKPYRPSLDDEGNDTGDIELNIKMRAQIKRKDGTVLKMKPDLFDAKGKKLPAGVDVWGGSVVKVAGQYNPFVTPKGAGCSLRLRAVQVLDLVSGGERNASAYGFGEEEGYEAPDGDSAAADTSEETDSTSDAADGEDF